MEKINTCGLNNRHLNHNISFKADHVTDISVLKKDANDTYVPCNVSVMSIEPKNESDISALKQVSEKWKGDTFCNIIRTSAEELNSKDSRKIFVVTEQKSANLDSNKILCLISTRFEPSASSIYYMQTIPHTVSSEYNHVGTSFIEYLKTQTNRINVFCPSAEIIEHFYKNLGFVQKYPDSEKVIDFGQLFWEKEAGKVNTFMSLLSKVFK